MVRLVIIVVLAWTVAALEFNQYSRPMETYTVNLDDPPRVRWNHILGNFNSSVPILLKYYRDEYTELERIYANKILGDLNKVAGNDLSEEIRGIAIYWDIDPGVIVGMNILYETRKLLGNHHFVTTPNGSNSSHFNLPAGVLGCTSVVVQDPKGNVFHGRNLDWDVSNDMRNNSFIVDFVSNGSVIYTGIIGMAGQIGIGTGMSKKGFSITGNERSLGGSFIEDSIEALLLGGSEVSLFARNVLTNAMSYNEAVQMLSKHYIAAPIYYIVAGSKPNEGAVITRDRNVLNDLWQLNVSSNDPNSWYLLETNYDHWKDNVPPYDNRRMYANRHIRQLGQNVAASMAGLLDVLFTWPVKNPFTLETVLMNPRGYVLQAFQVFNVTGSSH